MNIDLAPFLLAALEKSPGDPSGGMVRLMRAVARTTRSFGCSLWRKRTREDEVIMLAAWYPGDEVITLARLQTATSCAGQALTSGYREDNDLIAHNNPNAFHPFLTRNRITRTAAHVINVPRSGNDDGWQGALSLYRRSPSPDLRLMDFESVDLFEKDMELQLRSICALVPILFRVTREHDALDLFRDTQTIVNAYRPPTNSAQWEENLRGTVAAFGEALQRAFRCLEVSIFLREPADASVYRCWFTTPGEHAEIVRKVHYRLEEMDKGFSGLCLLQDDPIRVADIRHPEIEVAKMREVYPRFEGHLSQGVSALVLARQGLTDEEAPPHAMMCCRLAADTEILGFVRCRIVEHGPVTFHGEDASLLYMVCQSFSQNLAAWWEAHRWEESMEVLSEYKAHGRKPHAHLTNALEMIERVVRGADINTARLLDSSRTYLSYVAYSKTAVRELNGQTHSLSGKRYPVSPPPPHPSLAADVYRNGKAERCSVEDPRIDSSFRDIKEMIVAPIKDHENKVYGVLDARTHTNFPPYALRLMEVIGRLVGTQHAHLLEDESRQRREAEKRQAEVRHLNKQIQDERRNVQAFEDAAHQIKTPLSAARGLLETAIRHDRLPDFTLLTTSLRRADMASKLINTFADIAAGRPLSMGSTELIPEKLAKIIERLINDIRLLSDEDKNLKFEFIEGSILRYAPKLMSANGDLLAQAVYNLLENAEKYSFPHTTISCYGKNTSRGKFCIIVTNYGERIEPHEVNLCIQRRWRGRHSGKAVGSGLGLYIVDKIMTAHSGRVLVLPTTDKGQTEIRLEF